MDENRGEKLSYTARQKKIHKTIDILSWILVFITICTLIATMLLSYDYINMKYQIGYRVFQIMLSITMIVASVSLYDFKNKNKVPGESIGRISVAFISWVFIFLHDN